jgi:hypothetical protein
MMQNTDDLREIADRCKRISDILLGSGGDDNSKATVAVENFQS